MKKQSDIKDIVEEHNEQVRAHRRRFMVDAILVTMLELLTLSVVAVVGVIIYGMVINAFR